MQMPIHENPADFHFHLIPGIYFYRLIHKQDVFYGNLLIMD